MSEKNETLADIVAWIRDVAQSYRNTPISKGITIEGLRVCDVLEGIADRIEAAAKREVEDAERRGHHAATKAICETIEKIGPLYDADSIGNAAKLREAVEVILRLVNEELEDLKDLSDEVRKDFISIRGWCDHALAAPARNCDRFTEKANVLKAYEKPVYCGKSASDFIDWLFAIEKGATDGSK